MTVQTEDLYRLAWELHEIASGKTWCEKRGLDFDAVSGFVSFHVHELMEAKDDDEIDYPGSLAMAIGDAFRLGWETRHQYGVASEEHRDDA